MQEKKPTLSVSRMTTFQSCGYKYYLQYVKKVPTPTPSFFVGGRAVHGAVERELEVIKEFGRPMEDGEYTDLVNDQIIQAFDVGDIEYGKGEDEETLKAKIKALAELYHKKVAPNIKPLLVEEWFEIDMFGPFNLNGKIDLCHEVDGYADISDLKTANSRPQKGTAAKSFQLTVYAFALEYINNFRNLGLNLRENGVGVGLTSLVANKTPVVDYQYTDDRGEYLVRGPEDFKQFINVFEAVAEGISKEVFVPGPVSGYGSSCDYCSFNKVCKYQKLAA